MLARTPAYIVAALLGAASLAACGLGGRAYDPPPEDAAAVVNMTHGFGFDPEEVVVPRGATVEWRNRSFFTHTVTADPARVKDPVHAQLPAGAEPFHSGRLRAGSVFRHTFEVPGTYEYVCLPHEGRGMRGRVRVLEE
ncbi:hypothetical protein HUS23_07225 [Ectothiorhodospiraceae bacterium 2226]|nr:hypothetical protein HUS23_07225 [Ectothiorhodospiraceae bacterium 2226]